MICIKIDDRDQVLHQWDKGQRLVLEGFEPGIRVDFGRCHDGDAPPNYTYEENDKIYVDIPDAALQQSGQLVAYFVSEYEGRSETFFAWPLVVLHRPKPADYVAPEEIPIWHDLQQQIDELKKGGTGGGSISVVPEGDALIITTSMGVTTDGDAIIIGGA